MSARIIVVELIAVTLAPMKISRMDATAPTRALTMGMTAARNDPSTTTSTMRATTTPMPSTTVTCGMFMLNRSPPTWTSLPGIASCRRRPASSRTSRWGSVNVDTE